MKALLDTNVIVRHLTGEPSDQAEAATRFLAGADQLVLTDVIAAETVYVLDSVYGASRRQIATALRALIAMDAVETEHPSVLLRSIDLYQGANMDFADAYLVAYGESQGIEAVASFDKGISKAKTVRRIEPGRTARQ